MPGASVELIGAEKVRRRLDKLVRAGQDAAPLMRDIGEHVLTSTRDRFDSQTTPDGTPWEPLSDNAKRRKQRNKDKILTLDGDLRVNLAYRTGRDSVEIGSPFVYAGTRKLGALQGAFGTTGGADPVGQHPHAPVPRPVHRGPRRNRGTGAEIPRRGSEAMNRRRHISEE